MAMTISTSDYTVGRGKPPLHTRFQKGQSGNPSGKPGPAKLAKQRFQRALWAALEERPDDLELSKPGSVITAIAKKMALDACEGRSAAVRQLLSLLETESARSAGLEEDAAEQIFTAADLLSLLQGKMQGNEKQWLADLLFPDAGEKPAQADRNDRKEPIAVPAPTTCAQERNRAEPFSLLQGKTQGSGRKPTVQICPVVKSHRAPTAARGQLMTGTAPLSSGDRSQRNAFNNFVTAGLVPAAHEHGPS